MADVSISDLFIYPVKSMAGLRLDSAVGHVSGLEGDRQWALFKPDGSALTQRQAPRMALIQPELHNDSLALSAPGLGTINVDICEDNAETQEFKIWKDTCIGHAAAPEVNAWIREFLQFDSPLVLAKTSEVTARKFHDPSRFSVSGHYFSDAAPYLVCNQNSLHVLNQAVEKKGQSPVDIRHFRPNIVVTDLDAFSEHSYSQLIDDKEDGLRLVDHCQRCSMITVNPDTGEMLAKAYPLTTLMSLNTMPDNAKAPAFGVNATLLDGVEKIQLKVGQTMRLSGLLQ